MVHTEGENNRVEIWKDYKNYEGLYQASNLGRVRSLDRWVSSKNGSMQFIKGRILKLGNHNQGYLSVNLCKNNKVKTYLVHRIIAETFLPNPDNLPCVNHKDEDKTNNSVVNLEWCTYEYNNNYGTANERMSKSLTNNIYTSREVDVYDLDMNFIETLPSLAECARKYNLKKANVIHCCNGGCWDDALHTKWHPKKRAGKHIFRYHK